MTRPPIRRALAFAGAVVIFNVFVTLVASEFLRITPWEAFCYATPRVMSAIAALVLTVALIDYGITP